MATLLALNKNSSLKTSKCLILHKLYYNQLYCHHVTCIQSVHVTYTLELSNCKNYYCYNINYSLKTARLISLY